MIELLKDSAEEHKPPPCNAANSDALDARKAYVCLHRQLSKHLVESYGIHEKLANRLSRETIRTISKVVVMGTRHSRDVDPLEIAKKFYHLSIQ